MKQIVDRVDMKPFARSNRHEADSRLGRNKRS